jgi:hypothetical protein
MVTGLMEAHWGMGSGVSALPALQRLGINGGTPEDRRGGRPGSGGSIGFGAQLTARRDEATGGVLGQRIEQNLTRLLEKAGELLTEHRSRVLALAHALESHKTLTGDDVIAVLEGKQGPLLDGRPYHDPAFIARIEEYHEFAVEAHLAHAPLSAPLPRIGGYGEELVVGEVVTEPAAEAPAAETPAETRTPEQGAPPVTEPGSRPANEPAASDHRPPTE